MASMFSAFNPEAYKTYSPNNIKGTFGGPSNVMGQNAMMSGQRNDMQGIMQLFEYLRKIQDQQQIQQPGIMPSGMSGMQSLENPAMNNLLKPSFEM